ncbi:MAG: sugar ABC transporter ATP-binding protein [Anaerolineae bacterium]|nr:sugar ABC transporter ATP-binding protein [Anaerolineae bacterium]
MSDTPLLELRNISKRFGGLQALDRVDFNLREGETHALVGENGAGKSTLMRILSGIYQPDEGEYVFDGKPVQFHNPVDALRAGIGMIHQELSVMPQLSVAENVFLGRQPGRAGIIAWKEMNRVAEEELHNLGFDIDVRRPLESYPMGIHQVVEVLRVILSGARVLIMDEPTTALSPSEVDRLIQLVDALRKQNRSIIYISHFLNEVMQVADRVTVLRNGQKIDTLDIEQASLGKLISLILGRSIEDTLPAAEDVHFERNALEVQGLQSDVFHDISFNVGAGEVVSIYGPIGAGHFDLARAIFGLYRFDDGALIVDGKPFPKGFDAKYAIKAGAAYAIESRRKSLLMDEPNYKNITMPHLGKISGFIPRPQKEIKIADQAMTQVHVQPHEPTSAVGRLSGGNQQKIAIARWLTFPPKVFIASEPTRGMDVGAKKEVLGILRDFRNQGYGVLVVSSEPETALAVADRIIVMSHGRIVATMPNSESLDKDALMRLV